MVVALEMKPRLLPMKLSSAPKMLLVDPANCKEGWNLLGRPSRHLFANPSPFLPMRVWPMEPEGKWINRINPRFWLRWLLP